MLKENTTEKILDKIKENSKRSKYFRDKIILNSLNKTDELFKKELIKVIYLDLPTSSILKSKYLKYLNTFLKNVIFYKKQYYPQRLNTKNIFATFLFRTTFEVQKLYNNREFSEYIDMVTGFIMLSDNNLIKETIDVLSYAYPKFNFKKEYQCFIKEESL
jgi:hypothetical protein